MKKPPMDVCAIMCATCPFRDGSPYENLRADLTTSALTTSNRICHSTGSKNAINRRTGKKPMICRGARNEQIKLFHGIGFLDAPTDEAWQKRWPAPNRKRASKG